MNTQNEDIPERVRKARVAHGWTQAEMAQRAGISLRAYQNFETRKGSPQAANLREILKAVGISADQEDIAAHTREEWSRDITVFNDMMGAYLSTLDDDARLEVMQDITRQVFEARTRGSVSNMQ